MAHRISTRRFRNLPRANDGVRIDGVTVTFEIGAREYPMPRWMWVRRVLELLLMSQTPGGRYALRHDGFLKLQRLITVMLPALSPIALDTNEQRAVWDGLMEYVKRYEWHMQAGLKKLYEIEKQSFSADLPTLDEAPLVDENPEVEAIRDGSLRRVR